MERANLRNKLRNRNPEGVSFQSGGRMETKKNGTNKWYVPGEAVRDRRTGQKMYVDAPWSSEIKCVYYNTVTDELVKLEVPCEDLEKVEETDPKDR
ncbi:hypothetical protein BWD12_01740 [Leptospira santarosai serovar Bananal]|uniref:PF09926 repeat protein n=1 Tax=Leptospira santarosai TaxID=28183 RepID=A0AB73LVX4_9LEPT|nr:hypothetical protein B2G51_05830 [Leptospira santarosai]OLY59389.1 hypothetical protein BV917_15525 [Leptospira santarosai serovar Guaricura]OLY62995.1 hypothetical protein BWD11_16560 [Leptospira santarosai serovar Grippotyphosa]ONF81636.1 hypothetical protein BWD12_01740 [Leptospira santarosai serovar Bananal]ONF90911.1 hypothetical protein BWD14_18995 [Leptospira santarosai]